MSRFWPKPLYLGLDAKRLSLLHRQSGAMRPLATVEHAGAQTEWPALFADLTELRRPRLPYPAPALQVTVADQITRHWMVTPPANSQQLQDLAAVAAARFTQLFDEPLADWQIQADWQLSRPYPACAVPSALLSGLRELCQARSWRLASMTPYWVRQWNRWQSMLPADGCFCCAYEQHLTLALFQNQQIITVRTIPLGPAPNQHALLTVIDEEYARHALDWPGHSPALYWAGSASWLPASGRVADWHLHRLQEAVAQQPDFSLALAGCAHG